MSPSVKQELFASYLAPILNTAYGTALYVTSCRDEAGCLVQEAAMRAYDQFGDFRPAAGFKSGFLRLMLDLFRARRLTGGPPEPVPGEATADASGDPPGIALAGDPVDPPEPFLRALGEQQLVEGFSRLPVEDRIVCALYFLDDLGYAEIAEVAGCPVATVRARLHRGRKALSHALRAGASPADPRRVECG
jgi:RNA polymerase sigma-70 factor (ECF subfamily)